MTLADSLKLPKAAIAACLQQQETVALIKADAEGAAKSGAQSTPTFYIDGALVIGAQPPELFRYVLDSLYRTKKK